MQQSVSYIHISRMWNRKALACGPRHYFPQPACLKLTVSAPGAVNLINNTMSLRRFPSNTMNTHKSSNENEPPPPYSSRASTTSKASDRVSVLGTTTKRTRYVRPSVADSGSQQDLPKRRELAEIEALEHSNRVGRWKVRRWLQIYWQGLKLFAKLVGSVLLITDYILGVVLETVGSFFPHAQANTGAVYSSGAGPEGNSGMRIVVRAPIFLV